MTGKYTDDDILVTFSVRYYCVRVHTLRCLVSH